MKGEHSLSGSGVDRFILTSSAGDTGQATRLRHLRAHEAAQVDRELSSCFDFV